MTEQDWKTGFLEKIEAKIAKHGWAAVSIFSEEETPPFSYSVGLSRLGLPEILVFGLPPDTAGSLINDVGRKMREEGGAVALDTPYEEVSNFAVVFRRMPQVSNAKYMRVTWASCGPGFDAVQMYWPDEAGVFPWEEGFDERFRDHQLMLGIAEERH